MKKWWTPLLLVLIFLALLANLAGFVLGGKSLASLEAVDWIVGGVGTVAGLALNLQGVVYTTKSKRKRDRSSFLWMRRGFGAGLLLVAAVVVDTLTPNPIGPQDKWKAGVLILLLSVPAFFFVVAARREYQRAASREAMAARGH